MKILKVDKFIHETQLSIDWQPPPKLKYLDVSDLPSYRKKPNTPNKQGTYTIYTYYIINYETIVDSLFLNLIIHIVKYYVKN